MPGRRVPRPAVAAILGLLLAAPATAAGNAAWTPDAALIAKIEAAIPPVMAGSLTDPRDKPVSAPDTLNHYARFYAGETVKGEQVVVVVATFGMGDTPGIHVVTMAELPNISGGGCAVIHFWYHVASGQLENVCNFPM